MAAYSSAADAVRERTMISGYNEYGMLESYDPETRMLCYLADGEVRCEENVDPPAWYLAVADRISPFVPDIDDGEYVF
jgi:hypothetical protein